MVIRYTRRREGSVELEIEVVEVKVSPGPCHVGQVFRFLVKAAAVPAELRLHVGVEGRRDVRPASLSISICSRAPAQAWVAMGTRHSLCTRAATRKFRFSHSVSFDVSAATLMIPAFIQPPGTRHIRA